MAWLISFALYGNSPKYCIGAIENARLAPKIYPEWTCRFYVDHTVPFQIISTLKSMAEVIVIDDRKIIGSNRMIWRFYAASDTTVDRFISRDCDSRLNLREKHAVYEWIDSGKPLHVMRDHPHHYGFPILGGMWGCTKSCWSTAEQDCAKWMSDHNWNTNWANDMALLADTVWLKQGGSCTIHDDSHEQFKVTLPGGQFVGQQWNANNTLIGSRPTPSPPAVTLNTTNYCVPKKPLISINKLPTVRHKIT